MNQVSKYSEIMADQDLSKLKVVNDRLRSKIVEIISITKFVCLFSKVAELREMLKGKGLNSVGNKQELIERLQAAMSESSGDLNEDDLLNVRNEAANLFQSRFHDLCCCFRMTSWMKKNLFWIQHTTTF